MYETIREWPRYLKVPFPIAKVHIEQSFSIKRLGPPWVCDEYIPRMCYVLSLSSSQGRLITLVVCE